jgi:hypothetical protein
MSNASYLKRIAELLLFHRIIDKLEDLTKNNLADYIMQFQAKENILVDGIIGQETLWRLQYPWVLQSQKLLFVRCEADIVPGIEGYQKVDLREDAAERYRLLRDEVLNRGGVITTAGGKRPLSMGANPHRSAKSMHYPGLAFDLALSSGFFKPKSDPFVITRGEDTFWIVWCRAEGGDEMELDSVYWRSWETNGRDLKKKVRGKFINFTKLCKKHGFYPINPRRAFTRSSERKYLSCEWWHFQATDLLIPNLSQFGIELLRIDGYTTNSIPAESENVWSNRKLIYKVHWM